MSDPVIIAVTLSIAAVIIFRAKYRETPSNYYTRRMTQSGDITHVREAQGPNPQVIMDILFAGKRTFGDDEQVVT